jgi:hypothetical protein
MAEKPTAADAEVILKLYDLRREAEMRKARHWWLTEFWPETAEDVMKIGMNLGTQENNWLRQVTGYWEMAASMANRGAVNADLFLEPSVSGEMFFLFAKIHPILKDLREKMQSPTMLKNVETLINSTPASQEFLKTTVNRVTQRRAALKEKTMAKAG